ncbi:hypothetical protein [Demequina phytophila]|uniref:hypothetical protein n=1 Tax=Demequina phytophila TaxID=1638981 RepID=UPI0007844722|nr:hypothetical protein [Demequina phytophila]
MTTVDELVAYWNRYYGGMPAVRTPEGFQVTRLPEQVLEGVPLVAQVVVDDAKLGEVAAPIAADRFLDGDVLGMLGIYISEVLEGAIGEGHARFGWVADDKGTYWFDPIPDPDA